jgi:hypothetical protein
VPDKDEVENMTTFPEDPARDDPDKNCTLPLVPSTPESMVDIVNAPLLVRLLAPVEIDMLPPVVDVLSPDTTATRPPRPESPEAIEMLREPPVPLVDLPDRTPIDPLLPSDPVPVFNDKPPLVPSRSAFDVTTLNAPLLDNSP